jgi:hypothetical protein
MRKVGLSVALQSTVIAVAMAVGVVARAGVSMEGGDYVTDGNLVIVQADAIVNDDATHSTGALRLELWAAPAPFPVDGRGGVAHRLAVYPLTQLPPGGRYNNVESPPLPFGGLPAGTWYVTLLLTQYEGADLDDGYVYDDYRKFAFPLLVGAYQGVEPIIEYYYAASNMYFITGIPEEIAALDSGNFEGWERTGYQFNGFDPAQSATPSSSVAVCRFFNDSYGNVSTHFYALHGLGCEDTIAHFPDFKLESASAFKMGVPDGNGNCAAGSSPVYRLFNNGMNGAPNHRYTTNSDVRDDMIAQGWTPEGYGIGVAFCSPD